VDEATLRHKLRDLRRGERRVRGDEATPTFDRFFGFSEGERVRYPFGVLIVLDGESRKRVFREYLGEVFRESVAGSRREPSVLLATLGLPPDATDDMVSHAFRVMAREFHPDLGGDNELMRELLDLYHEWRGEAAE